MTPKKLVSDTNPHIQKIMIERLRQMSAADKFRSICQLNQTLEHLALADISRRYPDADETERRLRLASRRVPADLLRKAFGWDGKAKGR